MGQLFMFAIMPPAEVSNKIDIERKLFAEKYNCIKALKPPVHITLYPPFEQNEDVRSKVASLHQWASTQVSFPISLHDFGFFKNKLNPVVYIEVQKNPPLGQFHHALVAQLERYMQVIKSKTYTPHFTIGYRDVPPDLMPTIERDYAHRSFNVSFNVNSFFLWRHDGKNWQILDEYNLGKDNQLF
jgi:2'-5' RNA ligase